MNRKLICILLTCAMMCFAVTALAEVPSKTTQDMASAVKVESVSGTELGEEFIVEITEEKEYATNELQNIASYLTEESVAPIRYFPEEVQMDAATLLPEEFNLDALVMYEFAPLTAINYDEVYGDVIATFIFATRYRPEQNLVAMVGVVTGEDEDGNQIVEWTALKAEAVEEAEDEESGYVKVYFPQELLPLIESENAMIAILSDEVAE